jgi:signal transduction histidine kinase
MKKEKKQPDRNHKHSTWSVIWRMALVLCVLCLTFAAGYGVTSLIYRFTGRPAELIAHVLSGIAGILILSLVIGISRIIFSRTKMPDRHNSAYNRLLEALQQISQGNFDVILDPKDADSHHQFAEAINEMAKNLGSLETMRQDFISNVSHEIQSPLTSIGGFAELLQKDGLSAEERRHYAAVIEAESKRLSSLSENLLKLSSLDNNKIPLCKKDFRLDKQLEAVTLTLEPQWSAKNLTVEADLQKCILCGDEDLLSQVWINLLNNAVKFTPTGGQITITLTGNGGRAVIRISDTGAGIEPEDQIHIFERFYKTDKARDRSLGGNGLGLSLVKKIVELHGGSVSVKSEIGKGTAFEISLPGLH